MFQNELVGKVKSYEVLLKAIATNIKKFRKQQGLTQEDMVDFGFNYRFYQRLESGSYSPNLKTLHKLSEIFEKDLTDIVKLTDKSK